MEEYNSPSPDYLNGFNEGYILAKHLPEIAEKIGQAAVNSDRGEGFIAGREQYTFEMKENRRPAWLGKDRIDELDKSDTASKEKELDKDEPELEI